MRKSLIVMGTLLLALLGGWYHYQHHHFNPNTYINQVDVSDLTTESALKKLEKVKINNQLYVDNQLIYQGKKLNTGVTPSDSGYLKQLLKKQASFFPNHKIKKFYVPAMQKNFERNQKLEQCLTAYLKSENHKRIRPVNAYATYTDGQVKIIKEKKGDAYDIAKMLQTLKRRENQGTIKVKSQYLQPTTSKSKAVQKQAQFLKTLLAQKATYKVQGKTYDIKAKDVITSASYQTGKLSLDTNNLTGKIMQINHSQATFGKEYLFKTSHGTKIRVKNSTYGWKLAPAKATHRILTALIKHRRASLDAQKDLYGTGFYSTGTGYKHLSNHGLGTTYAEVSLTKQHAWFYKAGHLVASVSVVTGNVAEHSETPKGVYYVGYKQAPTTLRGRHTNGTPYASPVKYWAPFTVDGCGFHDASWRHDWSPKAYLTNGSNGCVNIHPEQMSTIYHALEPGEPVVIY
ncbi:L,D-transpeptidase [Ligilactobacillus equi]|uniref:L,D-TPase catalytic domain-containing protein n=1 Tax=Ligilactobacillus equi DSM 15833 = JCM 10991 TaxID=1423740 RepID=A0A0R1TP82_9LACO|nr:L,D-transpeptidase [Ligilactobacillus equi]KRL83159.1 hypothetical protein FC36_GL000725 [Ligilactobacillus equi DSM 15833 = JCM 10991]